MFTSSTSKSTAAFLSGGVGSAVSTILIWIINNYSTTPIPDSVQLAIGVIITAGIAYISTYLAPKNTPS